MIIIYIALGLFLGVKLLRFFDRWAAYRNAQEIDKILAPGIAHCAASRARHPGPTQEELTAADEARWAARLVSEAAETARFEENIRRWRRGEWLMGNTLYTKDGGFSL